MMTEHSGYFLAGQLNEQVEGLVKVKLMHFPWGSFVMPELIVSEGKYFRSHTLDICMLAFPQNHASIRCNVSEEVNCHIEFSKEDFICNLPGNSQVYSCRVSIPSRSSFIGASAGNANISQDGLNVKLQLFHHTNDKGYTGISESKEIWQCKWNLQGTKMFEEARYVYFTNLETVGQADLPSIGMERDGKVMYALDQFTGRLADTISLDVLRRHENELTKRFDFWIDWSLITPPHLYLHSGKHQPGGFADWYEVLLPKIYRVAVGREGKITIGETNQLGVENVVELKYQDHLIVGKAWEKAGLEAPWMELDGGQSFTWHSDPDSANGDIFTLWETHANTKRFSASQVPLPTLLD